MYFVYFGIVHLYSATECKWKVVFLSPNIVVNAIYHVVVSAEVGDTVHDSEGLNN